jgi:hypothetical protein
MAAGFPTLVDFPADGCSSSLNQRQERRERRLERFQTPWRKPIAGLTACASELEDLADTFPALLFALVSGFADAASAQRACVMLGDGACLRDVAEMLGLPLWLRRLPAEAFCAPLPRLPADPDFSLRIINHIPRDPDAARQWLTDLIAAFTAAGPAYALWAARHVKPGMFSEDTQMMLGAWAWFSQHPGDLGHTLLRKPWRPDMSARRALDEFATWRRRLRLVDALGQGLTDTWLQAGPSGTFEFVALTTVEDFLRESLEMENCLDQFGDHLLTGGSYVFSIRRAGRRIACLEIGPHPADPALPAIVQLRGRRNRRVPPSLWQAAFAWLGSQKIVPRKARSARLTAAGRGPARIALWQPYLTHLAGTPYDERMRRWLALPQRARPARNFAKSKPAAKADPATKAATSRKSPDNAEKG